MKFLFASDSFKGTLSCEKTAELLTKAAKQVFPQCSCTGVPVADGGEGTADAVLSAMGGSKVMLEVHDPLMRSLQASYGRIDENRAIIEMAAAAGITLVDEKHRNPLDTTTFGVGEMICDAIHKGCRKFIVGIGGSATNDGGIGMLQALGYEFMDVNGKQVPFGAKGLAEIETIIDEHVIPELKECEFKVACDVTNPLCGTQGCSAVYGPQKGATPAMIEDMDQWLFHYARLTQETYPHANWNQAGTGAAGGLGFAFLSYTNAVLESGIQIILEETRLESYIKAADIVITGEGRLDGQTVMGKAPIGVTAIAKKYGKPVLAFSGCVTEEAGVCNQHGIDAFFPVLRTVTTLEEAMEAEQAKRNLSATVEQVFRLIKIVKSIA